MAKQTISKLSIRIGADAKGVRKGTDEAKRAVQSLTDGVNIAKRAFIGLSTAALAVGIAAAGWGIKLAAEAETARVSFEVLTGSAEAAQKTLKEIREFAASTPFQTADLVSAGKMLLAFNTAAKDVVPTLQRIGDVSAGIGAPIGEIAELYGKARVQGRLFGEDINQLTGRGIPIIQELAKQFGVAESEVKALVAAGEVGFANLEQAFVDMTSSGGKFFELTLKQSETLAGQWSTLKDNAALLATEVGEHLVPVMLEFIKAGRTTIDWLKSLNRETVANTAKLVAFVGVLGTALIVVPKIIAAVRGFILVLRALASAQAVAMAFGGPAGWAALAASVALAAGAAAAVHIAFGKIVDTSKEARSEAGKTIGEIAGLAEGAAAHINAMGKAAKEALEVTGSSALAKHLETLRERLARIVEPVKEILGGSIGALDIRDQSGLSAVNASARERRRAEAELRKTEADRRKRDDKRDKILAEIFRAIVTGSTGPKIDIMKTAIVG